MKIKKCDHGIGSQTLQTEHPRSVSSNLDFSSILSCWRRKQSEPTWGMLQVWQRKFVLDFRAPSESFFFCLTRFKVRNESEFSVIRRKEETGKLSREISPVAVSCKDVLRVRRTPSTVSGNSGEGDGLLNLMAFLSPARTDGTRRPSGFRRRRPPRPLP